MKGYKRAKGETGEGVKLTKNEGVDADMKITGYKRDEETPDRQTTRQTPTTRRRQDDPQKTAPRIKRVNTGTTTKPRPDERECLQCG